MLPADWRASVDRLLLANRTVACREEERARTAGAGFSACAFGVCVKAPICLVAGAGRLECYGSGRECAGAMYRRLRYVAGSAAYRQRRPARAADCAAAASGGAGAAAMAVVYC